MNLRQRCTGLKLLCYYVQVFHLEDIVEQTGYILEKDSEYSQRILEEEEEVSISVTQKGGKTLQHQVILAFCSSIICDNIFTVCNTAHLFLFIMCPAIFNIWFVDHLFTVIFTKCVLICLLLSVPGGDSERLLLRLGPGS